MYGIFVNENGGIHYAQAIVQGYKTIETRSRNVFKSIIGEQVAIIRTRRNKNPLILGYATIKNVDFISAADFRNYYNSHLVPPGSAYDCHGKGKWFYYLSNPVKLEAPILLPKERINHGYSYCEF